jgi:chromosome partitioning protein
MKVLAIANQKGGVGKTTTTATLGALLAGRGRRVLMIDMDPQASLTRSCGVPETPGHGMAEVLGITDDGELSMAQIAVTLRPGLDLAPSGIALASTEIGLTVRMNREQVLRRVLADVRGYDVALIDCGPSLGILVLNALAAADAVLVPTLAEQMAAYGLGLFLETVARVRKAMNPGLQILGILPTMVDARLLHHRSALDAMRAAGLPLLPVTIGRSVRVAEAVSAGETIADFDASNPRAREYEALTEEVDRWLSAQR